MIVKDEIKKAISESLELKNRLLSDDKFLETVKMSVKVISAALRSGKKLLIAGNGGSAADSQHIAAEFVGRFLLERKALRAIALTTDTSIITAVSNDFGYESVFARQIEALGEMGDVFFAISTSGNSKNLIKALRIAQLYHISTISLTGMTGNEMEKLSDICISVPSKKVPRIQECHIMIGHIICDMVEKTLTSKST
ncbi:Phosphoheptose isomerase [Thermodesulfobium narugense DSM 14796]|uniref:Phosphoheptose isomerase n=1 Tax=Thermodesulfobium narugense DSM 14796 TaxID=747365 RepID=M1E8W8_9BACT|nr:D-sedoheptulose 7-phosphate isomerase [Thermodesulfobium narugense]AEE15423.1 Phosphoheptose isomerase [Thermodesulfobium narugense DSM 14796]